MFILLCMPLTFCQWSKLHGKGWEQVFLILTQWENVWLQEPLFLDKSNVISSRNFQSPTKIHFHCLMILILKIFSFIWKSFWLGLTNRSGWFLNSHLLLPVAPAQLSHQCTEFYWVCSPFPLLFGWGGSLTVYPGSKLYLALSFIFLFYLNNFLRRK